MIRKTIIVMLTLAAVASGVLWIVSPRHTRWSGALRTDKHAYHAMVRSGGIVLRRTPTAAHKDFGGWWVTAPTTRHHRFAGFMVTRRNVTNGEPPKIVGSALTVQLPLWAPLLVFATYPTIAFIRGPLRRWRARRKPNHCTSCGYNLTGNVSGVCSECGEKVDGSGAGESTPSAST